jgi:hypothetical protein
MDCRTARLLLHFARPLPSELPAGEAHALEAHLTGCPECEALALAERQFDARLGEVMRQVPVPDGLRERILGRLTTERGDRRRVWVGWTARAAAVAALVVIGVIIGVAWRGQHPPELDLAALLQERCYRSLDYDGVRDAFQEQYQLKTATPTAFNYGYLKVFGLAECQGRRVPCLFFAHNKTEAWVYVVNKHQFDLAALPDGEAENSGGYHAAVMRADDPDHAFVIIYAGDSLKPLLRDDSQGAQ